MIFGVILPTTNKINEKAIILPSMLSAEGLISGLIKQFGQIKPRISVNV